MKNKSGRTLYLPVILLGLVLAPPGSGQYREYYIFGKVLDSQKNPLEGVEITVRDVLSNRSYTVKTKADGQFKFAGLPHATYKVVFMKEGFAAKEDEWKLAAPQDAMKKMEIPAVLLATQAQFEEAGRMKEMEGQIKEAFEKILQNDYDGSITILKDALAKKPDDSSALYLIGLTYSKKQMYAEAIETLTQVIDLTPNFAPANFELAICYQNQGNKEKALEFFQKTLELDANNPDAAYNAGLILFELNRVGEALANFDRALKAKPGVPEYLEMAGRCYINQGDFPKAIEYLEQAKAALTDPERIKFLDELIAIVKEQIKKEMA